MFLALEIAWAVFLGLVSLFGYPPLVHSLMIRKRTADRRIKLELTGSSGSVLYPYIAAVFAASGIYCIVEYIRNKDPYRLARIFTDLSAALYFFLLWLNRKSCYLTGTHLILPESAGKAGSYAYLLGEDSLKLSRNSNPGKTLKFRIPEDRALLEKMLLEHYKPMEGLIQCMKHYPVIYLIQHSNNKPIRKNII
ncbi:MAG: hypothetical protein IKO27_07560 [Ruminococcus sp.]|nr:hypothetical protein [Ruminococcus sp.]